MALTGHVASQVLQRMQISGSIKCCLMTCAMAAGSMAGSAETHVLEVHRLPVDADRRPRNPARESAGLDHAAHQRCHEGQVLRRGQPLRLARLPLLLPQHPPPPGHPHTCSLSTRPSGDIRMPASAPIRRLKALCGTLRRVAQPAFSSSLFQRVTPATESLMKSSRSTSLSALSIGTSFSMSWPARTSSTL